MKISEIMTSDPVACLPETPIAEIAKMMIENDCGSIPVCESEQSRRLAGIVTDRDIVVRAVATCRDVCQMTAGEVMSHPVVSLDQTTDLRDALKQLESNQIRRVPVVDQYGQLVGIVAQADIALRGSREEAGELVHDVSKGMDYGHML